MTDKQISKLAKENQINAQKKSATPEVWPVDKREEEFIEKEKIAAGTENKYTTDPQENMEGVLSTIVQKVKETSNPSSDESKEEANKKKDENT